MHGKNMIQGLHPPPTLSLSLRPLSLRSGFPRASLRLRVCVVCSVPQYVYPPPSSPPPTPKTHTEISPEWREEGVFFFFFFFFLIISTRFPARPWLPRGFPRGVCVCV